MGRAGPHLSECSRLGPCRTHSRCANAHKELYTECSPHSLDVGLAAVISCSQCLARDHAQAATNYKDYPWLKNWVAPTQGMDEAGGELHEHGESAHTHTHTHIYTHTHTHEAGQCTHVVGMDIHTSLLACPMPSQTALCVCVHVSVCVSGEDEMWSLAQRLRKRFPNILRSPYLPRRYPIVSTQVRGARMPCLYEQYHDSMTYVYAHLRVCVCVCACICKCSACVSSHTRSWRHSTHHMLSCLAVLHHGMSCMYAQARVGACVCVCVCVCLQVARTAASASAFAAGYFPFIPVHDDSSTRDR